MISSCGEEYIESVSSNNYKSYPIFGNRILHLRLPLYTRGFILVISFTRRWGDRKFTNRYINL